MALGFFELSRVTAGLFENMFEALKGGYQTGKLVLDSLMEGARARE